jgi:hypothetical protein
MAWSSLLFLSFLFTKAREEDGVALRGRRRTIEEGLGPYVLLKVNNMAFTEEYVIGRYVRNTRCALLRTLFFCGNPSFSYFVSRHYFVLVEAEAEDAAASNLQ